MTDIKENVRICFGFPSVLMGIKNIVIRTQVKLQGRKRFHFYKFVGTIKSSTAGASVSQQ